MTNTPENHQDSLKMYVNDVIGLERDVINAIEGQLQDARVKAHAELTGILQGIVAEGHARLEILKAISDEAGGSVGAAIKEAAMSVTGVLAGVYGKIREHPLSRIVRDDRVAMNVVETSYAMLYTLALAIGDQQTATVALSGLKAAAPAVLRLTDVLPAVVLEELAADGPLQNPGVADEVLDAIHQAWSA